MLKYYQVYLCNGANILASMFLAVVRSPAEVVTPAEVRRELSRVEGEEQRGAIVPKPHIVSVHSTKPQRWSWPPTNRPLVLWQPANNHYLLKVNVGLGAHMDMEEPRRWRVWLTELHLHPWGGTAALQVKVWNRLHWASSSRAGSWSWSGDRSVTI